MPHSVGKGGGPSPFSNAFQSSTLGSLRYNTSQAGQPIPIVYGTQRVSVNLLEFWGFRGGNGKGGKGGITGGDGKKSASYSVDVAFAICQGPTALTGASHAVAGFNRVWSNAGISYSNLVHLNFFAGNDGQAPDASWIGTDPNTPLLGYSGTTYVNGNPLQLGNNPALPNISFEVCGSQKGTAGPNFPDDARPDLIISDMLTNSRYGAGFPSSAIDATTFADYGTYCQAAGLAFSMLMDRVQPAARWVEEIIDLSQAGIFFSCGLLKIVPFDVGSYAQNGATWTANLTVRYTFNDSNLLSLGSETDPIITTIKDSAQISNWVAVEYMDSANNYNTNTKPNFNQAAIDAVGLRTESPTTAHCVTNLNTAASVGILRLNRKQRVRRTFKFKVGWKYARLEPMDIVNLTDPGSALGSQSCRILSIDEDDNFELTIEAEEIPGVTGGVVQYPNQAPNTAASGVYNDPGNANAPIIFEPSTTLTGGGQEVWMISSGGADWGGANVWVSTDNATYTLAGTIFQGARQGVLTAGLPLYGGANPDNAHTLSVDLTQSGTTLVSGSVSDASNFVTLCVIVDGANVELLSYQTATLTSAFHYNLTVLYRGLFTTTAAARTNGAQFAYLGLQSTQIQTPGLFRYAFPANLVGQTAYVKLQSFNKFGNNVQDLASLTPATFVL